MIDDGINYFNKINIELTREDFNPLIPEKQGKQPELVITKESSANDVSGIELPFYSSLKIACGHFKTSEYEEVESYFVPDSTHKYGNLNPETHFIATASGNSMHGGKNAVEDGDLLLLEWITPSNAGSISGQTMAIEIQDESGDDQYLLRVVKKQGDGQYLLVANNPEYEAIDATEQMKTFARLKAVLS